MNKLLVTEALDERALLVKRINQAIDAASLCDVKKNNETNVLDARISEEEFKQKAESSYQQITDLINRYQVIDAAIVTSNANTMIETSYGTMSVAAAISLRNRLRKGQRDADGMDFERRLESKMELDYRRAVSAADNRNRALSDTAENMRLSILGREAKGKEDKPLEVVESYVKENTAEVVDVLNLTEKVNEIRQRRETLLTELETGIKVSNATTVIEL